MFSVKRINRKKPLPTKKQPKRVYGEQSLEMNSSPSFNMVTTKKLKNIESITSHTYIKYASEGNGFAVWKEHDNKFALAVDNIYLRKGGVFMSSPADDLILEDYVRIDNASIHIACYTPFNGHAIEAYGMASGVGGVYGASHGTGYAIHGQAVDSEGYSGYFTGAPVYVNSSIKTTLVVDIKERSAAPSKNVGWGRLWVKDTTPCQLWFTDDAGTSTQIV